MDLPIQATEVKNISALVKGINAEIILDRVIVRGLIEEQIFLVGPDARVHYCPEQLRFCTWIDVPNAKPGMNVQVKPNITDLTFHLAQNGTRLAQRIGMNISVLVTETTELNLVPGAGPLMLIQEVIGAKTSQTLAEKTETLTEPAVKVTNISAHLEGLTAEVIANKVIIQGRVHKEIFYIARDNQQRYQAEVVPFNHFVDIPGAAVGMNVQVEPKIEHLAYTLKDPITLEQKVILTFLVTVTQAIQFPVASGEGPELLLDQLVGENQGQLLKENAVPLTYAAKEVRDVTATVRNIISEIIPGKILIQGKINEEILYLDTANVERHQGAEVAFSYLLNVPGALPGSDFLMDSQIEAVLFTLEETQKLRIKVVLKLSAQVLQAKQALFQVGKGPLAKVEHVIGSATKQALIIVPA